MPVRSTQREGVYVDGPWLLTRNLVPGAVVYHDVAQRDQEAIFLRNFELVRSGGTSVLMMKARSADVSASPAKIFESTKRTLATAGVEVIDFRNLEPFQADPAAFLVQKP